MARVPAKDWNEWDWRSNGERLEYTKIMVLRNSSDLADQYLFWAGRQREVEHKQKVVTVNLRRLDLIDQLVLFTDTEEVMGRLIPFPLRTIYPPEVA